MTVTFNQWAIRLNFSGNYTDAKTMYNVFCNDAKAEINEEMYNMDENYAKLLQYFSWEQVLTGEIFDRWLCGCCADFMYGSVDYRDSDGNAICDSCFHDSYFRCEKCQEIFDIDDMIMTQQEVCICPDCADHHYHRCDNCGEWTDGSHCCSDRYNTYCNSCMENYYICDDCGTIIYESDSYSNNNGVYCEDCYQDDDDNDLDDYGIHEYGYKPDLNFKGEGILFFGTELEIDNGNRDLFKFDNLSDTFYCCNDGSLDDEGFEIISHPMTYEWIMRNHPYKDMLKLCKDAGFKSHDTTTCGFHVHMSRKAFNNGSPTATDARITSFILFFEKFWNEIVKFSRRKYTAIEHYAARICDNEEKEVTHKKVCDKKNAERYNRYHCVNLSNSSTIEVRIFRGSLNEQTLIAAIQLCKLFHELSVFDTNVIETMTWAQLKKYAETDYPELTAYMIERGL